MSSYFNEKAENYAPAPCPPPNYQTHYPPKAIAPPLMLTLLTGIPSSLTTATDWAANASFISNRSTSSSRQPAWSERSFHYY